MKSLEWCILAKKFFDFKYEAKKYNFYTPELANMEKSLLEIQPFPVDDEILNQLSGRS